MITSSAGAGGARLLAVTTVATFANHDAPRKNAKHYEPRQEPQSLKKPESGLQGAQLARKPVLMSHTQHSVPPF
jgi:hypothetical protein